MMFEWVKRALTRAPKVTDRGKPASATPARRASTAPADINDLTLSADQQRLLNRGLCPYCAGALLAGPSGGMATNALCEECHEELNIATIPGNGVILLGRNGIASGSRLRVFGVNEEN